MRAIDIGNFLRSSASPGWFGQGDKSPRAREGDTVPSDFASSLKAKSDTNLLIVKHLVSATAPLPGVGDTVASRLYYAAFQGLIASWDDEALTHHGVKDGLKLIAKETNDKQDNQRFRLFSQLQSARHNADYRKGKVNLSLSKARIRDTEALLRRYDV